MMQGPLSLKFSPWNYITSTFFLFLFSERNDWYSTEPVTPECDHGINFWKKKEKKNSSHGRVIAGNSKASVETETVTESFNKKSILEMIRAGSWEKVDGLDFSVIPRPFIIYIMAVIWRISWGTSSASVDLQNVKSETRIS